MNADDPAGLRGRVVLLTGASGGIGQALARRLAGAGMRLGLAYGSNRGAAEQLAAELRGTGTEVITMGGDLADPGVPMQLLDSVHRALGPVDVLVNNAGLSIPGAYPEKVDLTTWDRTHAVNLRAPFLLTQGVLPEMVARGFGRVLFISSVAALNGGVIGPHYASSKAGLHGLLHHFALRVAKCGVTLNAIAPALIEETGMLPRAPDGGHALPIPVGRLGKPFEVADLAMAVLRNGYLTNQVIALDGGLVPR